MAARPKDGPVAFIKQLGLPEPATSRSELQRTIQSRHGEAGWATVQQAIGGGVGEAAARRRYRALFAEPKLAIDLVWSWSGGVTLAAVQALEDSGRLDGLGAGDVVLDVGCGEGLVGAYVAWRTGARVVGLDLRAESAVSVAHLAEQLDIALKLTVGSLLRPPAALKQLAPTLVLAFRVLHEVEPSRGGTARWGEWSLVQEAFHGPGDPSKALTNLTELAGPAPIMILERERTPTQIMRRTIDAAACGHPASGLRLLRVDGLDGSGWFPFLELEEGAAGLTPDDIRAAWEITLKTAPPWRGWAAELVLERSGASLKLGGVAFDGALHEIWTTDRDQYELVIDEHGLVLCTLEYDRITDLERALREDSELYDMRPWNRVEERPALHIA